MMQMVHSRFNALLSACVLSLIATASWSQSITWLGVLPNGGWSSAYGVSADGAVVVGYATNAAGQWRAFRWTASGGMQDLGTLPGGNQSAAYGVSANGAVVVGWADSSAGRRAFRWENGVMQDLGTLPGTDYSVASGVSADGSVVVGYAINAAGQARAFRWTEASGQMQDLGTPPGTDYSAASGVSADGSVVVGTSVNDAAGDKRAFRWTASGGMENLNTTYASLLTNGSYLVSAIAISPDGRYIVGSGYNAATGRDEAFLLDTRCTLSGDVNGDGIVDDADLLIVLFNFGNRCP
jgi:probable HAF family extracellular repeat protein